MGKIKNSFLVMLSCLQVEVSCGWAGYRILELRVEVWDRRSRLQGRDLGSKDGTSTPET